MAAAIPVAGWAQGAGWSAKSAITINTSSSGANVAGAVAGFPLAVKLTAANFDFDLAKADGSDLRFTKEDGTTPLPFQIETWDKAAKKAAVWVKVDVKGNDASQKIMMHWGNPSAPAAGDGKAVFATADKWIAVYHLNEPGNTTADGYKDATGNEAHGTGVAIQAADQVDGMIGKATNFVNKNKPHIGVPGPKKELFQVREGSWSISFWATTASWVGGTSAWKETYHTLMSMGDDHWTMQRFGSNTVFEPCVLASGHLCAVGKFKPELNAWHHFHVIYDRNKAITLYIDGQQDAKATGGGWKLTSNHSFAIGTQMQSIGSRNRSWDGIIDEARVTNSIFSLDYIKLDFESQKAASKLLTFAPGSVGVLPLTIAPKLNTSGRLFDLRGRVVGLMAGKPESRSLGLYVLKAIPE